MSDFMNLVFYYLERAAILAVGILPVAGGLIFAAFRIYRKKYGDSRKFPWMKAMLILVLTAYLTGLLYITVIRGSISGWRNINLHLFRAWREAWNTFSEKNWLNVLLNIGMFVPLGILLPLLSPKLRKWYWMLPAGFLATLTIEVIQYISCRGLCDVDDLFANTLGAMFGFWAVMAVLSIRHRSWKKALCHGLALLLITVSVGGVFVAYELQEYGNLPMAPAFRVDTSGVQWRLDCELSNEESTVAIYKTSRKSSKECEAIGRAFLESIGVDQVDVTVYNEEVYLREFYGNRIAEVFFADGHLEYWDLNSIDYENVAYAEVEEEILRSMLREFGIEVPEAAELSYEGDGVHIFWVSRHIDGNTMIDGELICTVEQDFGLRKFENRLISFTYYGEAEIISAEAAVEQVKSGMISGGDWFERVKPAEIHILSCELVFQVDTKGFYQPVYEIFLEASDGSYSTVAYIPAFR